MFETKHDRCEQCDKLNYFFLLSYNKPTCRLTPGSALWFHDDALCKSTYLQTYLLNYLLKMLINWQDQ